MFYLNQNEIVNIYRCLEIDAKIGSLDDKKLYLACDDPNFVPAIDKLSYVPNMIKKDNAYENKVKQELVEMGFTQVQIQEAEDAGRLTDIVDAIDYLSSKYNLWLSLFYSNVVTIILIYHDFNCKIFFLIIV